MAKYPFDTIEPKWQNFWETHKTFKAVEDPTKPKDKRAYVLDMFPTLRAPGSTSAIRKATRRPISGAATSA